MGRSHGTKWSREKILSEVRKIVEPGQRLETKDLKTNEPLRRAVMRYGGLRLFRRLLSQSSPENTPLETNQKNTQNAVKSTPRAVESLNQLPTLGSDSRLSAGGFGGSTANAEIAPLEKKDAVEVLRNSSDVTLPQDEHKKDDVTLQSSDVTLQSSDVTLQSSDVTLRQELEQETLDKAASDVTLQSSDVTLQSSDVTFLQPLGKTSAKPSDVTTSKPKKVNNSHAEVYIQSSDVTLHQRAVSECDHWTNSASDRQTTKGGGIKGGFKGGLRRGVNSLLNNSFNTNNKSNKFKDRRSNDGSTLNLLTSLTSSYIPTDIEEQPQITRAQLSLLGATEEVSVFESDKKRRVQISDKKVEEAATRLFAQWKIETRRPSNRNKLTRTKIRQIGALLRQGYTETEISQAIQGFSRSDWHRGNNPHNKRYDDWDRMVRSGERIELGMRFYDDLVTKPKEQREKRERDKARRQQILEAKKKTKPPSSPQKPYCPELDEEDLIDVGENKNES